MSVRGNHPHLLAALREELDDTSPKDGCSPSGQCGCCTVMLDGKAVVSCTIGLDKAAGRSVVTLEGVDAEERQRFADAFAACGGLQCGFCIPGMIMAGAKLIEERPDATQEEALVGISGNICRCTGYRKILDAMMEAKGGTANA